MTRQEKGYAIFKKGYSCAQAVTAAFSDDLPMSEEELLNLSVAFGGGFARTRSLCGAVSAMGLLYGLFFHTSDKGKAYEEVGKLTEKFSERNASLNCGELLKDVKNLTAGYRPQVRDEEYYRVRPCLKFVLDAVEIMEEFLIEKGKIERGEEYEK